MERFFAIACIFCAYMQVEVASEPAVQGIQVTTSEDDSHLSVFKWDNGEFWCPKRCTCSLQENIIDCSSLVLKQVPKVPLSTKRLYLHNNLITRLAQQQLQSLHQLTYLILSGNKIRVIDSDIFSGLHKLKYLILDSNNITDLSCTAFQELADIETISLARNGLRMIPANTFINNGQLTLVNLQGNRIRHIERGAFSGLHSLTTLNLEDNLLDEGVFEALQGYQNLSLLRLNGNRIRSLPHEGLNLSSLKYLTLHSNGITHLPRVLMKSCSSLEIIILNNNKIEEIGDTLFENCSSLVKIHFQSNHLRLISSKALSGLNSLKELYLSNNQLKILPAQVFHGLTALVSLHLERNEIFSIKKNTFRKLSKLEIIYLHHNLISLIQPGAFSFLPNIKKLVLHKNKLRIIQPSVFLSLDSLQTIQLDPLKCSCGLLPLATWLQSHNLKGINCIRDDGSILSPISRLKDLCHGLKGSLFLRRTPTHGDTVAPSKDHPTVAPGMPKGPLFDLPKCASLGKKITLLEKRLADLSYKLILVPEDACFKSFPMVYFMKVLRLESLLKNELQTCERVVCVYEGVRLQAGDKWKYNGGRICSCLHDGSVQCLQQRTEQLFNSV